MASTVIVHRLRTGQLLRKQFGKLVPGAVVAVRIDDELGVRQILLQNEGVDSWEDDVIMPCEYKYGLFDGPEVAVIARVILAQLVIAAL